MDKMWNGKWIMDPEFYGLTPINLFHKEMDKPSLPVNREDLKNHHMLVRKRFAVKGGFKSAYIDISADDYYKLYINGQYVGQGPASSYYFHYNYNRYDITRYLNPGDNVVAVHVYYQGLVNRVWNSGDFRQGMIAEMFTEGMLYLASDSTWKYKISNAYKSGGIIGYDTQYLENIDSRLFFRGWNEISFDDSLWENVMENITDDHKLFIQPTPNLEVYEIKPQHVEEVSAGHYLVDFGHEITGQFKMKAKGRPGDVIEIRCGEELDDGKNSVRNKMRCNCNYQEYWTLSGEGIDTLEHYDYKAFRYVELMGHDEAMDVESFCAVVRHYPLDEESCVFTSSNGLLNKIWEICRNGIKYGTQENFVDCPSREKGQYLGDVTITGHSHMYISGDLKMYRKALWDFAYSSIISRGIMAVSPGSFMQEIADYSLQWPMQLLQYYNQSGDVDFIRDMHPVTEGIYEYFRQYQRDDGLLENVTEKWNIVDWPENLRDNYDFKLDKPIGPGCHNVINAFYCGFVRDINKIRSILGIGYKDEFPVLRESYIKAFFNSSRGLFVDCEGSLHSSLHSNALALLFGLNPLDSRDNIVGLIKEKGLNCGVYMAYFVLKALAKAGEYGLVYELVTSMDEHSWGNMIKEGATTCFEAWGKDQKWNTSLCHPWASGPIPIIIEDIIGLTPNKPGWEEVRFEPHIPGPLDYLKLYIMVKTGKIKIEYSDGKVKIDVPHGIRVVTKYNG